MAVVGVRWQEEQGIKSYWATNGKFPENDQELLLGSKVAGKLGLDMGSNISLFGQEFLVSGVLYETGTDDDTVVLMDLSALQTLLNRADATSFIEVAALCSGCPIGDIVAQLQQNLPGSEGKALQNIVNQRMASVHFVQRLALCISLVILITASAMVGLSMLSAVNERKKDIGIRRSLGYGKGNKFFIICLEAGLIGIFSGKIGYLSGYLISFKVLEFLKIADGVTPTFSTSHLFFAAAIFGLVTVLAALYPSWKGARVEPSAALVAL